MEKTAKTITRFIPLTDNDLVPLETLFSAKWVHGIELGFDDVRYDEVPEEILYSEEARSGLLLEEEGNLYYASHSSAVSQKESVTSAPHTNGILTEKEVARHLGISWWTVRRWRVKEGLPCILVGNQIFYRLSTVIE